MQYQASVSCKSAFYHAPAFGVVEKKRERGREGVRERERA